MNNVTLIITAIAVVLLGASFLAAVTMIGNIALALQLATVTLLALLAFMQLAQRTSK